MEVKDQLHSTGRFTPDAYRKGGREGPKSRSRSFREEKDAESRKYEFPFFQSAASSEDRSHCPM
jgi:hypothetical protein